MSVVVDSANVEYSDEFITASYEYDTVSAKLVEGKVTAVPQKTKYTLRTARQVPKTGLMLIG